MADEKYSLPLLLYDDECPMCVRFAQSLKMLDATKSINSVSIYDVGIYKVYPELDMDECEEVIHLIDENHVVLKGPAVLEYLIKTSPAVSKFSWLIERGMGKHALEFFYNRVNDYRNIIKSHCTECHKRKRKV